jgi:hypothetical protein
MSLGYQDSVRKDHRRKGSY